MESHITRFGENLIERAPEYEVIKMDKKQRGWIKWIKIKHDIFKHKRSIHGNLMDKKQDEDISLFLLSLASMLVDGEINSEGTFSQAALAVARY